LGARGRRDERGKMKKMMRERMEEKKGFPDEEGDGSERWQ
jgi:hypothetical protein